MPIIDLQQRMRQLGEIRIGELVDTGRKNKNGDPIRRPSKLNRFRFTSPSKELLDQVAALYGGTVKPWTPANGGPSEFELYSTSNRLPVLVPPRNALTQWYEQYKGSKCVRRCDGRTEQKSDRSCMCDPVKRDCAITTRLNVMLRDVPALGVWLLTSHGYYAALELPASAELLAMTNGYIPGWLGMEEKRVSHEDGMRRFQVPTLDVEITPAALLSGQIPGVSAGKSPAALTTGERAALEGKVPDYVAQAKESADFDAVVQVRNAAQTAGHLTQELDTQLKEVADAKRQPASSQQGTQAPAINAGAQSDEPRPDDVQRQLNPADYGDYDPDVVIPELVDPGTDEVWMQMVMAAGGLGWTTDQLEKEFAARNGGTYPGSADISELRAFLAALKSGAIK